jgi:hypothetical protein
MFNLILNPIDYKTVNCPICEGDEYKFLFYIYPRQIVECQNCGHEYVNPIPSYSKESECFFPTAAEDSPNTNIDLHYLNKIFRKYALVNCRLLDLGCGPGR